ncbi:MAG: CusA/CzcA family heavy metal efflux RND transporter [Leptospiraceae bacterium]|nr:CusA/CzcA family heavy metal efflux RND transporter [Leptospiraceae bacterium]
MIESIIQFSIKNRFAVILATFFFVLIGLFNAAKLSIDAVPDITNVQVSAVTSSPGLSPLEVEQFITYPIELEFNGMPKVKEIRSISRTGVSAVTVIFEDGTDIYFARQLVNERLKMAEEIIPNGYGKPELSPIATGLGDIYEFTLSSEKHTKEELKTYMKWEIARQIRSVKGIIDVNIYGGDEKQYQIKIDPRRLQALNLTLSSIAESLESANMNVGGGYISKGEEQIVIRGESQFKTADEIRKVAIRTSRDGIPVLLGQIAIVEEGPALHFGLATQNGKGEVVTCTSIMLMGENSLEIVDSVKNRVEEIKTKLPEGMVITSFYDRSEFISRTLSTVFTNLIEAAALVLLILIVTLGSIKGALAVALAIPVSMLIATIFMNMFGVVGNLMSLGALDFGLLVDGSIVMLESVLHGFIYKQAVLETQKSKHDLTLLTEDIILRSCQKVARASTFSVGIILLVYLPLMTLEGTEGRMFRPMAITVALALGAALVYSLTTFPALLSLIYKEPIFKEPAYWEKLNHYYESKLNYVMQKKLRALFLGTSVTIFCLMLGGLLGSEFLPKIDEGELEVDIKRLPSTSLYHSKQLNTELENVLLTVPEVTMATSRMGRGDSASEPVGTEEGTIMVKLRPRKEWTSASDRESLMEILKSKMEVAVPSSYISISQPIENKVNALLSGSKADIVIKIFGDDLNTLKDIADDYAQKLKKVPGSADLRVQRLLGLPLLEIKADREKMARYGVSSEEILTTVQTLRVGYDVGKVYEGYKRFDLIIRLDADVKDMDVLQNVPVMSSTGEPIPLGQVAKIELNEGPSALYHDGLKRRILVETNVRGRDMIGFVNEAIKATSEIEKNLPSGYNVSWGGQFENFTRAKNRLSMVVPVALLIIFGMLFIAFGNVYYALGVFILVPFSAAGGVLSLVLRGLPFSIPAGVGFIAAAGISVLNGVVFASYLKSSLENNENIHEAVTKAAVGTLRAVITTVLVAVIGFLPMAIASSAGAEVQRPLATVVIGGVLFATLMALFLLPPVFQFLVIAALKREESKEEQKKELERQFLLGKSFQNETVSQIESEENDPEDDSISEKSIRAKKRKKK